MVTLEIQPTSPVDSIVTRSVIEGFTKLFDNALKTSPTSGNGFGLALAICLGFAAISGLFAWVVVKRYDRSRDKLDSERKSDIEALNAERKQDKIDRERESSERLAADERLKREFAVEDQRNRNEARSGLTSHLDTRFERVIDHIDTSVTELEKKLDAGKDTHANLYRDFVLLKQAYDGTVETLRVAMLKLENLSEQVAVLKSKP